MASGTYNFSPGTGGLIVGAFRRIQVARSQILAGHIADAVHEANLMQAEWSNGGPNLWTVENLTIQLIAGQGTYDIPPNTNDIVDAYISINETAQPYDANNDASTDANVLDPAKSVGPDRFIDSLGRTEFAQIPDKNVPGQPSSYWFQKGEAPKISFWPIPDQAMTFNYWRLRQIQDAKLVGGGAPDVPYLWLDAYTAGIAYRLSRIYAPALEQQRKMDAMEAWTKAAGQDTENVPLVFAPAIGSYWS